jgi:hypothetical protein
MQQTDVSVMLGLLQQIVDALVRCIDRGDLGGLATPVTVVVVPALRRRRLAVGSSSIQVKRSRS